MNDSRLRQGVLTKTPIALMLVDVVICAAAAIAGGNRPNRHFIEGGLITWINGLQLVLACLAALVVFSQRRHQVLSAGESAKFWLLASVGSLFLAFDEVLTIHESLGQLLRESRAPRIPLLNGYGDAVLLAYGLLVLGICWYFRGELRRDRIGFRYLLIGTAFLVVSEAVDFFGVHEGRERFWWSVTEESCKLIGFGALLGGILIRLRSGPTSVETRRSGDGVSDQRD